ncbi:MAG: sulfite exporter TauE/SafE family protein [Actinobacteria bacterium]|nr:MAG: sulfite exporter TauE/SafE family protein [Actinomycetota bacterium]
MDAGNLALALTGAAAAGWVDAVVGGGGLIQLPTLLLAAPALPLATVLGTNKLASVAGTSTAAATYLTRTKVDWRVLGPAVGLALCSAGLGALLAGSVPGYAYRPVVLVVLAAVAVVVTLRPRLGTALGRDAVSPGRKVAAVALAGLLIAAYDGAIGPGTGTFLILTFTATLGVDFLHGSAMAKAVNVATNVGALVVFGSAGHVAWLLGAGMATANVLGARLGAHTALRRGSAFVRVVLLVVVLALLVRLGTDEFFALRGW